MDLLTFLRLARRGWRLILITTGVAICAALAVTALMTPVYAATATMLVSADDGGSANPDGSYQAMLLSQERVKSYAGLLTSNRVLSLVAGDVESFRENVRVEAVPETVLLRATVTSESADDAALLAGRLSNAFAGFVEGIEKPATHGGTRVRVAVVDPPQAPDEPVSPRPVVNVAIAIVAALLGATLFIVLRSRTDTTITSAESLQEATESPTLATVGFEPDAARFPLITRRGAPSSRAEALRFLRTNLQSLGLGRNIRSLAVSSPMPGDGKSSMAVNLAIVLAQADWRVALVDCDLRQPRLAEYLGIKGRRGLSDVLLGRATAGSVMRTWGTPEFSVIPAGPIPPNPSELLGGEDMLSTIAELMTDHHIVIIDTPPVLPVTDPAVVSTACHGTLLVARHGKTREDQVKRAAERLTAAGGNLMGVVLNFAPISSEDGYGYGYGYRGPTSWRETVGALKG